MYTTFSSDGACLPPVIFTGVKPPPGDDGEWYLTSDKKNYGYVVYIEGLASASTRTTEIYLETIFNKWERPPEEDSCFVMDVAPWHVSAEARALWDQYSLHVYFLPATTGKWLNPNDQAIHAVMRGTFNRLQRQSPANKIRNILDAYYSVKDETVTRSWRHTCLLKGDYEEHLRAEACRGFRAGVGWEAHYERGYQEFTDWAKKSVRAPSDTLPGYSPPTSLGESNLDGKRWSAYGTSKH